jgi:nucleoside-diphosphate-sugar epimerase
MTMTDQISHPSRTEAQGQRAIVTGAAGAFGIETAIALNARGWRVEGLMRDPPRLAAGHPYGTLHAGDVRDAAQLAATGPLRAVIHAANPPYNTWARDALPMLDGALQLARETGAMFVFPGNIYNFGPDAGLLIREDAPQNPVTRKGAIRKAMELRLRQEAAAGMDVRIIRAPDFFGPRQGGSWFRDAILSGAKGRPKSLAYPGDPAIGHSWAYLPDLGEATARLIEARLAPGFHAYGFPGTFLDPGSRMTDAISTALGARLSVKAMPWGLMRLISPFAPMIRELFEMRYLWAEPHRLDGAPLQALIGPLPQTPLDKAVAETLAALFPNR